MNGLLTLLMVCCLGAVLSVQGIHLGNVCRLPEVERKDIGSVLDKTEIDLFEDDSWEDASGHSSKQKYNYNTWMGRNTANFLRNLDSENSVEVEGGKVCLIFIPVGTNCKPALGIIAEKDVHRLRKLGSQFVLHKDVISNDAFMVECTNNIMWLKWMKLEF